jgi:hypothetical protein
VRRHASRQESTQPSAAPRRTGSSGRGYASRTRRGSCQPLRTPPGRPASMRPPRGSVPVGCGSGNGRIWRRPGSPGAARSPPRERGRGRPPAEGEGRLAPSSPAAPVPAGCGTSNGHVWRPPRCPASIEGQVATRSEARPTDAGPAGQGLHRPDAGDAALRISRTGPSRP